MESEANLETLRQTVLEIERGQEQRLREKAEPVVIGIILGLVIFGVAVLLAVLWA